jgi:lambda family phage portal protein
MRTMIRQMAAGTRGVSYESLSKDYSQSNYSSSRLALLDDRDAWRAIQGWFIRTLRHRIHKSWLKVAVYSGLIPEISQTEYALNPRKFEAVRFKPRGWSWIDPSSEVESFEKAIKDGMTTLSTVVASTADGRDLEDIVEERKQELEMIRSAGLAFETNPEIYNAAAMKDKAAALASARPPEPPKGKPEGEDEPDEPPAPRRVLSLTR